MGGPRKCLMIRHLQLTGLVFGKAYNAVCAEASKVSVPIIRLDYNPNSFALTIKDFAFVRIFD